MSDPIGRLRRLEGMAAGQPLPAEEVRRLGDRMRRRRRTVTGMGAAAVVAVVTSGVVMSQQVAETPPVAPATSTSPTTENSPAPDNSPSRSPQPDWVTEVPEEFPLGIGLPDPGGDVPPWRESRQTNAPWPGLPCPSDERTFATTLEADAQRTDAWSITVQPPAEVFNRLLVLYPDGATAEQAMDEIRAVAEMCGPREAVPGLTEFRYSVADEQYGEHGGLLLGSAEYFSETGELTGASRSLNMLVRVGNAVLLTGLGDESDADAMDLDEPKARELAKATALVADEMCVFAADPCD